MTFQELVREIGKWRQQTEQVASEEGVKNAEEDYQDVLEREFLAQGKSLLRQYDFLQGTIQELTVKGEALRGQLEQLKSSQQSSLSLEMGSTLRFDLSFRPSIRQFWQEAEQRFGHMKSPQGSDEWLQALGEMNLQGLSEIGSEKSQQKKLYDPVFLAQESDDLLDYL